MINPAQLACSCAYLLCRQRALITQAKCPLPPFSAAMADQSTEHPARPITGAAVRAIVHKTSWILTSLGGSKTAIDFETRTDPKGSLPTALVGFMQMKFPRDTVSGFVRSARDVKVHPAMTKW